MDDVGNGRIETGNCMVDRVPGYPVPELPESPSTNREEYLISIYETKTKTFCVVCVIVTVYKNL